MYLINFVSVETLSTGQMIFSERVSKLLLTTSGQFFSHIMARTSFISNNW